MSLLTWEHSDSDYGAIFWAHICFGNSRSFYVSNFMSLISSKHPAVGGQAFLAWLQTSPHHFDCEIFHRTSRSWARMARLRRAVERKNPSRISICIYFAPRLRCCQKLDEVKNLVLTMGLFKENTENQCKQLSVARFIIFLHWHGKTLEFHNNASIKCPWECLLKSCWSNVFISQDFD